MQHVHTFAKQLIATKDLDPIYVMLNAAQLDWDTRARFCLAYWMFYHAGVAARCAEAPPMPKYDFWYWVNLGQKAKWPRGTERRHFRGEQSRKAIESLSKRFPEPEEAVRWVSGLTWRIATPSSDPEPFQDIRDRVLDWRGFGNWIAFKVADMVDAVLEVEVDFHGAEPYFFDDPMKGGAWATMLGMGMHFDPFTFNRKFNEATPTIRLGFLKAGLAYLSDELHTQICPHNPTRTLRLQEYETILCKYKSHLNGKYEVGKDTREILHALTGWGDLAEHLQVTLRKETKQ
jgi:hypothetical protein